MPLILNGTTGVSGIDGSAGTPSYVGGDSDTGLWYPAANTLALSTGGSERLRIDSSGNVGIGTSSPTARLGIPTPLFTSSATGGMIRFQNPDVAADSCIQSFYVTGAGSNIWIGCNNYIDTNGSTVRFSGSYASSAINLSRDGTLQFYTSTGTATERMRIDSSGRVGIGTSSPAFPLDVRAATSVISAVSTTGTNSAYMYVSNTGGDFYLGRDNSAGTTFGTGTGYSAVLYSAGAYPMVFFTNSTERMRITSGGDLLVGTTTSRGVGTFFASSGNAMGVEHSGSGTVTAIEFRQGGPSAVVGSISMSNGNATAYNTSSDHRLKENIAPMTGALAKVAQLKPCTYTWKATGETGQGFIAHELQEVVPDAVTGEKDAVDAEGNPRYQGVDTSFLVATLTAAIQEQQAMIEELKAKVAALEK